MNKEPYCNSCDDPNPQFYPSNKYTCKKCLLERANSNYVKKERLIKEKKCRECGTTEGLARAGKYPSGQIKYENICVFHKNISTADYKKEYRDKNKYKINKRKREKRILNIKHYEVKRCKDVVFRWYLESKRKNNTYDEFLLWLSESEFSKLEFDYKIFFSKAGFDGSRYILAKRFE